MFQCVAHPHEKCMHHDIQQYHMIPMKLQKKKVPAMYSNRSTSNHTHGLVPCTQEFILHNPIDEHLNLQQIVLEPATNNVRPCNKQCQTLQQSYTITSNSKPCALPFSQGFTTNTRPAAQRVHVYMTYSRSKRVGMRLSPQLPACALVNGTFKLPFNLSF
jgi:hypothetical protein